MSITTSQCRLKLRNSAQLVALHVLTLVRCSSQILLLLAKTGLGKHRLLLPNLFLLEILNLVIFASTCKEKIDLRCWERYINIAHPQAGRSCRDLFEDLRDGHNLLSLLEVLSGEILVSHTTDSFFIILWFFLFGPHLWVAHLLLCNLISHNLHSCSFSMLWLCSQIQ